MDKKKKTIEKEKDKRIREIDFRYGCVSYDYDTRHNCESNGCDSICRCGRITNLRVTSVDCLGVARNIVKKAFQDFQDDQIFLCCVDRIVRANYIYEGSAWELTADSGYYGEEVGNIKMDGEHANTVQNDCEVCATALKVKNVAGAIEHILSLEYGFVLELLKNKNWSIKHVEIKDIEAGSKSQMRKVDRRAVTSYRKKFLVTHSSMQVPIAICLDCEGAKSKYRLFDGYHRYSAALLDKVNKVHIIVGEDK